MKYRREMTAKEHIRMMERNDYIRVIGKRVIICKGAFDDEDEMVQIVIDYIKYFRKNGYQVEGYGY